MVRSLALPVLEKGTKAHTFFFFLRSCHSRGIFINRPECSYGAIPCCSLELKNEVFTQGGNELIKIVNV